MSATFTVILVTSILVAIATYYVSIKLDLGPVIGSALISFLVSFPLYLFPESLEFIAPNLTMMVPVVVIGSSFAAMSSAQILSDYHKVATAGAFFAFIWWYASSFFAGFGGGLGTTACISVVITLGLMKILKPVAKKVSKK